MKDMNRPFTNTLGDTKVICYANVVAPPPCRLICNNTLFNDKKKKQLPLGVFVIK